MACGVDVGTDTAVGVGSVMEVGSAVGVGTAVGVGSAVGVGEGVVTGVGVTLWLWVPALSLSSAAGVSSAYAAARKFAAPKRPVAITAQMIKAAIRFIFVLQFIAGQNRPILFSLFIRRYKAQKYPVNLKYFFEMRILPAKKPFRCREAGRRRKNRMSPGPHGKLAGDPRTRFTGRSQARF